MSRSESDAVEIIQSIARRDKVGEKIIYICQEQIDNLIEIICNVADFFEKNETMSKKDFNNISLKNIDKVQELTKRKHEILKEYEEESEKIANGKLKWESNNGA